MTTSDRARVLRAAETPGPRRGKPHIPNGMWGLLVPVVRRPSAAPSKITGVSLAR
ncbi:hypothetical protein [Gordonia aichiensis]|uniref:hypothetical protein n=1 Tax=Gordonia aichiensis TaxID=36820 RepID=UPI0012F9569F|nr:hypothetical protein [Gordonia aichiensis]